MPKWAMIAIGFVLLGMLLWLPVRTYKQGPGLAGSGGRWVVEYRFAFGPEGVRRIDPIRFGIQIAVLALATGIVFVATRKGST